MTAKDRTIPEGGENPYANHPGFDADDCPLRITITPAAYSSSYHGFACSMTGGHCLTGHKCDDFRKRAAEIDARNAEILQAINEAEQKGGA